MSEEVLIKEKKNNNKKFKKCCMCGIFLTSNVASFLLGYYVKTIIIEKESGSFSF